MPKKESIKGNCIVYDSESYGFDIEEILAQRFEPGELLEKNLADLHDPYLLADMEKAVERIMQAHQEQEKVIIF